MIEWEEAQRTITLFARLLDCRAGKLLLKGKAFIVVAIDEPYYLSVYKKIRRLYLVFLFSLGTGDFGSVFFRLNYCGLG